jgi:hypothetical protein
MGTVVGKGESPNKERNLINENDERNCCVMTLSSEDCGMSSSLETFRAKLVNSEEN